MLFNVPEIKFGANEIADNTFKVIFNDRITYRN
jgi:hypothetical protein